jgi:hypothetical protein
MLTHTHHFHRVQPPVPCPAPTGPKPILPMVQLPIYRVRCKDFEKHLAKVYRFDDFDFCLATGFKHGECPEYVVQANIGVGYDIQLQARRIRSGRRSRNIPLIFNILCLDGYIPAGKYIIDTHEEVPPLDQYRALLQKTRNPSDRECIAFRERHRSNKTFRERAALMDKAVTERMRELEK